MTAVKWVPGTSARSHVLLWVLAGKIDHFMRGFGKCRTSLSLPPKRICPHVGVGAESVSGKLRRLDTGLYTDNLNDPAPEVIRVSPALTAFRLWIAGARAGAGVFVLGRSTTTVPATNGSSRFATDRRTMGTTAPSPFR